MIPSFFCRICDTQAYQITTQTASYSLSPSSRLPLAHGEPITKQQPAMPGGNQWTLIMTTLSAAPLRLHLVPGLPRVWSDVHRMSKAHPRCFTPSSEISHGAPGSAHGVLASRGTELLCSEHAGVFRLAAATRQAPRYTTGTTG